MVDKNAKISLIPLGGLGEVGKNMTVIKYEENMIVIDAGLMFPEDEMLGVDMVIPDYTYLLENKEQVKAIILTHGHEDHIGALPYVLKDLDVPVYGTKLTLGLLEGKLKEHHVTATLNVVKPRDILKIEPFKVEFIKVSHSIADAVAVAVHTPLGIILHTGDFKIDMTPIDGEPVDFHKFAALGERGVLLMMSDSTNVERLGYTQSERSVGETFDETFRQAKGRIILASFASNVHRVQQAIWAAAKYNRKVAVIGRSMVNVVNVASELGYLKIPKNTLIEIDEVDQVPGNRVVILTTGSQGEPMSGLTRMAMGDHRQIHIVPGDTIIISAVPIPGNEKSVARSIDHLFKLGADVIYESIAGIHVSGHASQEELKLMINIVKPKFFVPVHGEYRMLYKHAKLAEQMGIPAENIFIGENGQVIDFTKKKGQLAGKVQAGRVLVDGLGVGDVGNVVLKDRKQLSQDGIVIITLTVDKASGTVAAGPDLVSRGFVYVKESEKLMEDARRKILSVIEKYDQEKIKDWSNLKSSIRDTLGKYLYEKTKRKPMIIPIISEM
ncbi:ribonuclease J [Dehalobacterium formicoaceticum]|uniref:Ribonuclease J n=1 Tax=Dehalobacterium formicoaceticum TaxID=51515 RepID=A0ABT1Y601_9FIRM|nr:ribonuclease J [Dehalobacterium formicoaceticum]MCR6545911.1 ribonuclease J [Dehalobacterium formicoaceticum]